MKKLDKYPTIEEASKAAQKLNFTGQADYRKRYKDDNRLPSSPQQKYGQAAWDEIGGIKGFLGMPLLYKTIQEASKASKALGISSRVEYREHHNKDPSLPSDPKRQYPDEWACFGKWKSFIVPPEKPEKISDLYQLEFEKAALKKGYSLDKDECDRYEDCYLQEAWEIFSSIDLKP